MFRDTPWSYLILLVLTAAGWQQADDQEPSYEGVPRREWIRRLSSLDSRERLRAANVFAVTELGKGCEEVVPPLVDLLEDPLENGHIQVQAKDALVSVGKPAVESLVKAMQDRDFKSRHLISM